MFYSQSHGGDYVDFFQQWMDLKTPLERDFVGMSKPYFFSMNPLYQKDVEERRGSVYIDDDLASEFVVIDSETCDLWAGSGIVELAVIDDTGKTLFDSRINPLRPICSASACAAWRVQPRCVTRRRCPTPGTRATWGK